MTLYEELEEISLGDRPVGDRPVGDRPVGDRPVGDRPVGDRPVGDRPVGDTNTTVHTQEMLLEQGVDSDEEINNLLDRIFLINQEILFMLALLQYRS